MNEQLAAGPGSVVEQGIAPKPLLEGASGDEVVEVFNPLPVDFYGLVGQSKPIRLPFEVRHDGHTQTITKDEGSVAMNYGVNLLNKEHPSNLPITNKVLIPSGKSVFVLGNEAQVIVRQLVNELMQREGKRLMLADPYQRHLAEQKIVRSRRSVEDAIGRPQTVESQINSGIGSLNEVENEQEFPGLNESAGSSEERSDSSSGDTGSRKRSGSASK